MYYRYFPLLIIAFLAKNSLAQIPMPIQLDKQQGKATGQAKAMACVDQDAGTIALTNFVGQSNDIDLDTIYFCYGDEIAIVHDGNANLTGDPQPVTVPGITYAYLSCQPTIGGPDLTTILTDPCIVNNPVPVNDLWITAGGQINGNITFSNTGVSQNVFNNGDPVLLWFAPITVDAFPATYESSGGGAPGPCTNMSIDEAFAVVYLNEITSTGLNTNTGISGCEGTFDVFGGLPEFDGSEYSFTITLIGNNAVQGQVTSGPATHGSTVTFQVPVPGVYTIAVEDGKSCGSFFLANMSACINVSQSIESVTSAPGDFICVDVTNVDGFNNIAGMSYGLTWDENVLEFVSVTNTTSLIPSFTAGSSFSNVLGDTLILAWFSQTGVGFNVPPNTVLYQVCFNVVGDDGECTDISYISPNSNGIDFVNAAGSQLGFFGIAGSACVSNSAMILDFATTAVTCPSGTNGSFTITVSGGTAPYQVSWQNEAGGPIGGPGTINLEGGSFTANNLAAGTYDVTVTDSQGQPLVSSEDVTVPGPPSLNLVFSSVEPFCNGDDNGSLSALLIAGGLPVNNPTASYTFDWSILNAGNVTLLPGLISGNYSVTVTNNATGCSITASTFLDEPPALALNIANTPATCSGIGDGSISIAVSGGTPNINGDYTINWPNAGNLTIIGTTSNVIGLISDSYQLIVTDSKGCVIDQNIWLPAIKVLQANAVITPIPCNDVCGGGIFLTAFSTGGTPDSQYNFDWFGVPVPPPPVSETATTTTMANLCEGTYTVVIENLDGCEIDTSFTFTLPVGLDVFVANSQNETCVPGQNGSITIGVNGGLPPFTYDWNQPSATGPSPTGLSAGVYTVTVTDDGGCSGTAQVTLTAPTPPTITALPDDIASCNNNDGSLTVTATPGGAPIVSYDWTGGLTGQTINNLMPGLYTVTVVDAAGCSDTDTGEVLASGQVTIDSFQVIPPICPDQPGGQVTVFVSGGAPPYFFNWSNGPSGNNIFTLNQLLPDNYSVTIGDASGCPPAIGSVVLPNPPAISVQFSAIDSVSCANTGQGCDGSATATALYSDGSTGLFDFTWISGEVDNNVASSTADLLCAGSQRVIVSDGVCFDTFFVNILAPPAIVPDQDIENVSCFGLADGEITLMPEGGTPPYDFIWIGSGTQGPTITGLPAGNYTAVITDFNNCNFTHTVTIIQPPVLDLSLNPNATADVSCPGETDGAISVVAQGGNLNPGLPIYLWQNGVAGTDQATATNLASGTYSVTVVDPKGCADSLTYTLAEPPPIHFILGEIVPIACFGQPTTITVDSVWGGNANASYVFSSGACVQLQVGEPCTVLGGTQIIEIEDVFNNCVVDTTIEILEPQEISVSLPAIVEVELGDSLNVLDPTIISSYPIDTFIWAPNEGLSCYDCKNPRLLGISSQTYTLTIIDINGCEATAQVVVDVKRRRRVYIPNVFSPNGDGLNDKFQVYTGVGVKRINFIRLYDRWGEKVYELLDQAPSVDGTEGWDGVFRGQDMNPAVFLYMIEVEFVDDSTLLYRGDVTLLR